MRSKEPIKRNIDISERTIKVNQTSGIDSGYMTIKGLNTKGGVGKGLEV